MTLADRINQTRGLVATMRRAGLIAPMRPDRYLRVAAAIRGSTGKILQARAGADGR